MDIFMKRGKAKDIILITLGTLLMAVSINLICDPMGMVTGGVTGIGIIVKHLTRGIGGLTDGIPVWLCNIICNIPLFLVSFRVLGIKYIAKTMYATVSLTFFIYIIPAGAIFEADYLLASVFGGIFAGAGLGLVFLTMSTTGGTDMLGMLIHKKKPYYSVPQLLMAIDGVIVLAGAAVFGLNKTLYAVITVYICSKVSDGLLDGMKFAKSAYIISDRYREIADEILNRLDRGVTGIPAKGMYSDNGKNILYCVASKKEMVAVLDIVYKMDPNAFVTVSDVREVMGEGFIEYKQ